MTRREIVALASVLALLACTPTGSWQNASVPEEQWGSDRAACQAWSRDQAERDFALDQQSSASLNYNRGGQWSSEMNRYSGQTRERDLFGTCMRARGYHFEAQSE
ncbi:MAG: hypothetical protein IPK66_05045 [Rhodospirillales bacterium]|nr:hypothetical protein [Rhodospirillales bacterium]